MADTKKADTPVIAELSYQLGDLTLAAVACGNKDHEPVLCLHGYLDNAASFLPLIQQIAQENELLPNRRIIALDWPGHGHSDHRSVGAHYHFFDYVSDLVALFELNNWQAIDIVAHSMGAMIASAFAAAFPEKVKSLELGYKGILFKKVFVDASYYYSWYNDFLGYRIGMDLELDTIQGAIFPSTIPVQ